MHKEFDAVDYLVKKYVTDEDVATIPVILKEKSEFFNRFDPTVTSLSPEIAEYLDHCAYNLPIKYKICLKIKCPDLDDKTKEGMKEALKHHYGLIVYDKNLDLRTNKIKTFVLFIIGAFILLLAFINNNYASSVDKIINSTIDAFNEIVLVAGWVFVWSAVDNGVFEKRKLKTDKINNLQMLNADVLFE